MTGTDMERLLDSHGGDAQAEAELERRAREDPDSRLLLNLRQLDDGLQVPEAASRQWQAAVRAAQAAQGREKGFSIRRWAAPLAAVAAVLVMAVALRGSIGRVTKPVTNAGQQATPAVQATETALRATAMPTALPKAEAEEDLVFAEEEAVWADEAAAMAAGGEEAPAEEPAEEIAEEAAPSEAAEEDIVGDETAAVNAALWLSADEAAPAGDAEPADEAPILMMAAGAAARPVLQLAWPGADPQALLACAEQTVSDAALEDGALTFTATWEAWQALVKAAETAGLTGAPEADAALWPAEGPAAVRITLD